MTIDGGLMNAIRNNLIFAGIAVALIAYSVWRYGQDKDDTYLFMMGWAGHMLWTDLKVLWNSRS